MVIKKKTLNENSNFAPVSPYASAKLLAYWNTRIYRQAYGLFASNGIMFNHESSVRGENFISKKTTKAVAEISLGLREVLYVGNLNSLRDWGYAGCLLYTSPSPRDAHESRMPSSA